jgi:hypothetical protein
MVPAEIEDSDPHVAWPPPATMIANQCGDPIQCIRRTYRTRQSACALLVPHCTLTFSPDHCLTLIPVMAAPVAITVYSFAFLILIIYTIDAIVQWRNPREESWKYFSVQVILIICIFISEVILIIYNEKEVKPAILHGL